MALDMIAYDPIRLEHVLGHRGPSQDELSIPGKRSEAELPVSRRAPAVVVTCTLTNSLGDCHVYHILVDIHYHWRVAPCEGSELRPEGWAIVCFPNVFGSPLWQAETRFDPMI